MLTYMMQFNTLRECENEDGGQAYLEGFWGRHINEYQETIEREKGCLSEQK